MATGNVLKTIASLVDRNRSKLSVVQLKSYVGSSTIHFHKI